MEALMHAWERRLATQDDHERNVLSFDWGAEFLGDGRRAGAEARDFVHRHVSEVLSSRTAYFEAPPVDDFRLDHGELEFTTPLAGPYPENNTAHASFFPTPKRGPAVVVLPQWNAQLGAQTGLCRLLRRRGLSALRLTLPYHGSRRPDGHRRAEYMLSPNIGRTIHACRQAILESRAAVSWLRREGYGPVGILGTSLGSAIAFIAFSLDERIEAAVLNHISPFFADVVWRGISTRQVREGLEGNLDLDELRRLWLPISPWSYYDQLAGGLRRSLLVQARYDLSFPPDLSREVIRAFRERRIPHETLALPCGHYSTAKFPFNWLDGLSIVRFLVKELGGADGRGRRSAVQKK